MPDYDEYLVSDLKTAKYLAKDRWLAPDDAFPVLLNAVVEKGILKRRLGSSEFGVPLSVTEPDALDLTHTTAISDVTGLQNMANDLDGNYYLTADIDASGVSFTPVGSSGTPFTGTFDGDGYRITGLTITAGTTTGVGLFGYIYTATIYNLIIEDSNIYGDGFLGALVGNATAGGAGNVIQGVTIANTIVRGGAQMGGLIGAGTATCTRCTTTEMTMRHVTGESYSNIGLFAGTSTGGTFTTCFANGTIEQAQTGVATLVGGFIGSVLSVGTTFTNCDVSGTMPFSPYSAATINTTTYGGFSGEATPVDCTYTNCKCLNTLQPQPHAGADEKQQVAFVGSDPTGGTYTLSFDGETTAAIAYNATAAVIQAALIAVLGQWNSNDQLEVEGTPLSTMYVYFRGDYSRTNVALMTLDGTSLTGGTTPHTPSFTQTSAGSYSAPSSPAVARDNGDTIEPTAIVGQGKIAHQGYNEVIVCSKRNIYQMHQDGTFTEISGANIFTGGDDDYFWFQEYGGDLYLCNGVDGIMKYTPNQASPNNVVAMDTGDTTIQTCRMMFTYKNRLIIVSPRIGDVWYPEWIYYTDVNLDNVGATNLVKAQMDITPMGGGYIGEIPVIFCLDGSIWNIAYTQNPDTPFTWEFHQRYHGGRARMGTAEVNNNLTTFGLTRMILYDGHEAVDFDENIRGFYDDLNDQKIINAYAHRFLDRNYLGMAYTRIDRTDHDRILLYNIDDKNFADSDIAAHSLFSLKGPWLDAGTPPGNFYYPIRDQDFYEYEFAGTKDGRILQINTGYQDEGSNIATDIRSAQLNPYQKDGFRTRLGWVKFYLSGTSGEGITVSFYKNDSATAFKTLKLDSMGVTKNWQTANVDSEVGDCFSMKIVHTYENGITAAADFIIYGMLFAFAKAEKIRNRTEYS